MLMLKTGKKFQVSYCPTVNKYALQHVISVSLIVQYGLIFQSVTNANLLSSGIGINTPYIRESGAKNQVTKYSEYGSPAA